LSWPPPDPAICKLANDHRVDCFTLHLALLVISRSPAAWWEEVAPELDTGPASLLKLRTALSRVIALLQDPVNMKRLMRHGPIMTIGDLISLLEMVHQDAVRAHRSMGKPSQRAALAEAYAVLADLWRAHDRLVTGEWHKVAGRLVPINDAARFLYDTLRHVCPDRPRLAEELRQLIKEDVAADPKLHRGRRLPQVN